MAAAGGGRCKIIPNAECRGGRQASSRGAGETGPTAAPAAAPPPRAPSGLAGRSAGLARSWPRLRLLLQERRFPMLPLAFPFLESPPLAAWDTQHCLGPRPLTGGAGAGHTAREDHQALRVLGAGRLRAAVRASSSLKPIAPGSSLLGSRWGPAVLARTPSAGIGGVQRPARGASDAPQKGRRVAFSPSQRGEDTGPVVCPEDVAWVSATFCRPEKKFLEDQ